MAKAGDLDPENSTAARPFWSGKPPFYWFVLIFSAVLLTLFPFQLFEILLHGDTLSNPGWIASSSESGWVVSHVPATGPVAGKLQKGDKLLAINGDTRAKRIGPEPFLTHMRPGERYTIDIQRSSKPYAIAATVSSTHVRGQRFWGSVQALVALTFLITGAIIGLAKPTEATGRYAFLSAALSAMYLLAIASSIMRGGGVKGWPLWTTLVLDSVFPLHYLFGFRFYFNFLRRGEPTRSWVLFDRIFAAVCIVTFLLRAGFNLLDGLPDEIAIGFANLYPEMFGLMAGAAGGATPKLFGVCSNLAVAAVCVRNYRLIPEGDQRRRWRWVFFGVLAASVPSVAIMAFWWAILALLPVSVDATSLRWTLSRVINVLVVVMPITITYAILKHRVLGVRVALRIGIQHLLATNVLRLLFLLPLAALIYEVVSQRDKTIGNLLFQSSAKWNVLLLACVAAGNRYRPQLTTAIDKRFFREAYSQEEILAGLADSIKQLDSVQQIAALLSVEITKALHPRWMAVMYRQTRHSGLTVAYASDQTSRELHMVDLTTILDRLEQARSAQGWSSLRRNCPPTEQASFDRAGASLLVPVIGVEHRLIGVLVLGEKKSEEPYTSKDRALLERVGHEAGIVYENLELRGLVRKERQIQTDVLARIATHDLNLVKECPVCGRCYDTSAQTCSRDSSDLSLSLPVERTIEGRYRLDRLIGKGGMGAVYEAVDLKLNRGVAVKVMIGRLFGNVAAMRRFSREAQASARLVHPNVVRVYDYGELPAEGAFLVLEHVPGVSWRQLLLENGTFHPDDSSVLFEQLLAGVEAAHQANIVHRDLKPENIIVQGAGRDMLLKILDFGLAKVRGADFTDPASVTTPGVAVGTFGYMSPEQYLGGDVDERADIYAIGVMALETLTGKLQLSAHSFHANIGELVQRRFSFEGATVQHGDLARCISKCVALESPDRYANIEELREQFLPALRACPRLPGMAKAAGTLSSVRAIDPDGTATVGLSG